MNRTLNIALWIAQVLLSITFLWAAYTKLFTPADQLAAMWPWTATHIQLLWITAFLDALAATGLVLSSLVRIKPKLVVYTAFAVITLMTAAIIFHISRNETAQTAVNFFIALLAAFIAWGRSKNGKQE